LPTTNIEVIENYYSAINQSQEVERVSYINEYRRLLEQATKVWNLYKTHIPWQERQFITQVLEREIYGKDKENKRNSDGINLLYKMSQYLNKNLSQFIKTLERVQNLAEERESKLEILFKIAKGNNLT